MKIVSTEEAEEAEIVACIRVAPGQSDPPLPGSAKNKCSMCGHDIWVAQSSPRTPQKACLECVVEWVEAKKH